MDTHINNAFKDASNLALKTLMQDFQLSFQEITRLITIRRLYQEDTDTHILIRLLLPDHTEPITLASYPKC